MNKVITIKIYVESNDYDVKDIKFHIEQTIQYLFNYELTPVLSRQLQKIKSYYKDAD